MENNNFQTGMDTMVRIMGNHGKEVYNAVKETDPKFAELVVKFGFGELYYGDHLSDRDRVIITLTTLISQSAFEQVELHTQTAINVGMTKPEIYEIIVQLIGYVGFPKTLSALRVVTDVYDKSV